MRKERLTLEEFNRVKILTRMKEPTLALVKRVLVQGESQASVHRASKKSRQHISAIVTIFLKRYESSHPLPDGWTTEYVTLPQNKWPQVRALEESAKRALIRSGRKSP
jgi:TrfB plasmid transcriptional repressor